MPFQKEQSKFENLEFSGNDLELSLTFLGFSAGKEPFTVIDKFEMSGSKAFAGGSVDVEALDTFTVGNEGGLAYRETLKFRVLEKSFRGRG